MNNIHCIHADITHTTNIIIPYVTETGGNYLLYD